MEGATKKYRLIKDVNHMAMDHTTYVIEKRIHIFEWTLWWSRNYLFDVMGCYEYNSEPEALNALRILNMESPWVSKTILENKNNIT